MMGLYKLTQSCNGIAVVAAVEAIWAIISYRDETDYICAASVCSEQVRAVLRVGTISNNRHVVAQPSRLQQRSASIAGPQANKDDQRSARDPVLERA